MALNVERIRNPFIQQHLEYVDATEPPRLFHIWAGLACVSACMQRHVYLDTGIGRRFGNMFVLLVGPPGTRKSTAINCATELMASATELRIAPDDTGGQRQGLIAAIIEDDLDEDESAKLDVAEALDIEAMADQRITLRGENRHVLFAKASEFGSFIGQNSLDLTRFLIKMWDGEDYQYRLRQSRQIIRDPLMTILGGTTPTDIASLLPPEAIGQGFMSRCILVYAPHKEKVVPPSKTRLRPESVEQLQRVFANVFYNMHGSMSMSRDAEALLDMLYTRDPKIQDTRFIFYVERRQNHLMKLAMVLAAARQSMVIDLQDVEEAQLILAATEERMPDALGEYGLSPVAVGRQKMLEYLRYAKGEPVSEAFLWAIMQRDMKLLDFKNSLSALVNAEKVMFVDTDRGRAYIYKDELSKVVSSIDEQALDALLDEGGFGDKHTKLH